MIPKLNSNQFKIEFNFENDFTIFKNEIVVELTKILLFRIETKFDIFAIKTKCHSFVIEIKLGCKFRLIRQSIFTIKLGLYVDKHFKLS